jgi:GntR family transcriptional repressor for pyruvate dehydrogenase complex
VTGLSPLLPERSQSPRSAIADTLREEILGIADASDILGDPVPVTGLNPLPPEPNPEPAIAIAETLREEILHAAEGDLLGSEGELMTRFRVSRPTFQQAMRILQSEGLLEVRRGVNGGLFARLPTSATVARAMSVLLRHYEATHAQVSDVLFALSTELARLAARNPDTRARRRVKADIAAFEPPADLDERTRILLAAAQFGELMAQLAANRAVTLLVDVFLQIIPDQLATAPGIDGKYGASRAFHRAVADAVAAGDEAKTQALMAAMRDEVQGWPG